MEEQHPRQRSVSRRSLLAAGGLATFGVLPRTLLGTPLRGAALLPPSERLHVAVIGVGGRGQRLIKGLFRQPDVQVVAIADPTEREDYSRFYYRGVSGRLPVKELIEKHYGGVDGAAAGGRCNDYVDYRQLLDKEKSVDAVVVATPDHVHAFATLAALRLKKPVYCEKPLTHSVEEARRVTEEARRAGVATQMGNQGNSGEGIRAATEWIRAGAIGEVREVHAWSGAAGWGQGRTEVPKETPAVPKGLDWDVWLGPKKRRAYHPAYAPYDWRGWWEFGNGGIGDMGCHNIDAAVRALQLKHPDTVEASCAGLNNATTPDAAMIHYTFPARGDLPAVRLTWYEGGLKPARPEEFGPGQQFGGEGLLFVGSKGKLLMDGWARAPRLLPQERDKEYVRPPKTLPRASGHDRAWLDAIKGGPPASSNFDYAGPLSEIVLLGGVAIRAGERFGWDGDNLRAIHCDKAEQLIRGEYRKGWTL